MAPTLRLGLMDCDTSHAYQFARRLNHVGIEESQWVDGGRVVVACPAPSRVTPRDRLDEYVAALRAAGVEIVDQAAAVLDAVDAVLLESNDAGLHRAHTEPVIERGLPVFVDKPLALTAEDARALVEVARRRGVPLVSCSALRFARQLRAIREDASLGAIEGVDVFCPAPLNDLNPGLFHYGVHGVEMLYALMGPGCELVSCMFDAAGEIVTGRWRDGRLGVLRGLRGRASGYGVTVFGANRIARADIDMEWIYHDLLEAVIPALAGGLAPVGAEELVEVVAFQEAALASRLDNGRPVEVDHGG